MGDAARVRLAVLCGLALWAGMALVLSQLRWFSRPPLLERLRPYSPAGMGSPARRSAILSVESFRDVVRPLCRTLGERMAHLFGVSEELSTRLERIHSTDDVTSFRVRQVAWSMAGFGAGALFSIALHAPVPVALLVILSGPLLGFLVPEQQVASASDAWRRRLNLELPVVAEQLAMLLSAGYSLGAALNRLAARGGGNVAKDLTRVCGRIRQGLTEMEALREWAEVADVEALHRLLPILGLNREASDLGRLYLRGGPLHPQGHPAPLDRDCRAPRPTGVDPRHGGRAGPRRDLPRRPVHGGAPPLRSTVRSQQCNP